MRFRDTVGMATSNLRVRWLRTSLNLVGITLSCILVLGAFSVAAGIRAAIQRLLESSYESTQFAIIPGYDKNQEVPESVFQVSEDVPEERRQRLIEQLQEKWRSTNARRLTYLSRTMLDSIVVMEHVLDVAPNLQFPCAVEVETTWVNQNLGVFSNFDKSLADRLVVGSIPTSEDKLGLIIDELLAFELGYRTDTELGQLIGESLTLQFRSIVDPVQQFVQDFYRQPKSDQRRLVLAFESIAGGGSPSTAELTDALEVAKAFVETREANSSRDALPPGDNNWVTRQYRIVGIVQASEPNSVAKLFQRRAISNQQMLIHHSEAQKLASTLGRHYVNNAMVFIDDFKQLQPVSEMIEQDSIQVLSASNTLARMNETLDRTKYSVFGVGLIVLLVSSVGISNTMMVTLMERSEEIGIMKAVGASNRDVARLIQMEGALVGFLGGVIGVLCAVTLIFLGNDLLIYYVEQRTKLPLSGNLFSIELWMILSTIAISVFVTTTAGVWPAYRAARMHPIRAMKQI